jgi:hypothetical protein
VPTIDHMNLPVFLLGLTARLQKAPRRADFRAAPDLERAGRGTGSSEGGERPRRPEWAAVSRPAARRERSAREIRRQARFIGRPQQTFWAMATLPHRAQRNPAMSFS